MVKTKLDTHDRGRDIGRKSASRQFSQIQNTVELELSAATGSFYGISRTGVPVCNAV